MVLKLFDSRKAIGFGILFDPLPVPFLAPFWDPYLVPEFERNIPNPLAICSKIQGCLCA